MSGQEIRNIFKSASVASHDDDRRKAERKQKQLADGRAQTWQNKLLSKAHGAANMLHRSLSDSTGQTSATIGQAAAEAKSKGGEDEDDDETEYSKWARESKFTDPQGPQFEYTDPLKLNKADGECMRLLELLPGQPRDEVRCMLRVVRLKDAPPYHALSYAWGSEQHPVGVYANDDKVIRVTPNLRSAFRHLRSREESLLLWVDAICINQNDAEEKNWQVSMMSKFYRASTKTIIWIGPAFDDSLKAIQVCRILARAEAAEASGQTAKPAEDIEWGPEDKEQAQGTLDPVVGPTWNGEINTLLGKPWFDRAWVVQEAVLSTNAEMHCGFESIAWSDVMRGISYAFEKHLLIPRMFRMAFMNRIQEVDGVVPIRKVDDGNKPADMLLDYLMCFRHRQATLPADKVFSLLGLVENADIVNIKPDYTLSTDEVYRNTTVQILKNTNHLDVFGAVVEDPSRSLSLSWVADWRYDGVVTEPFRDYTRRSTFMRQASKSSIFEPRFEDGETTLVLKGYCIGKIEAISEVLPMRSRNDVNKLRGILSPLDDMDFDSASAWQTVKMASEGLSLTGQFLHSATEWLAETITTLLKWEQFAGVERRGSTSARTYWETLSAGTYLDGDEHLTETEYNKWYDSLADNRSLFRSPLGFATRSKTVIFFAHLRSTWKTVSRFPELISRAVGRRMARIDGRLALVPPTAMLGDDILLCKGGKVPLIARQSGPFWLMLGESYVDGVMQGELFREEDCEDLRFR